MGISVLHWEDLSEIHVTAVCPGSLADAQNRRLLGRAGSPWVQADPEVFHLRSVQLRSGDVIVCVNSRVDRAEMLAELRSRDPGNVFMSVRRPVWPLAYLLQRSTAPPPGVARAMWHGDRELRVLGRVRLARSMPAPRRPPRHNGHSVVAVARFFREANPSFRRAQFIFYRNPDTLYVCLSLFIVVDEVRELQGSEVDVHISVLKAHNHDLAGTTDVFEAAMKAEWASIIAEAHPDSIAKARPGKQYCLGIARLRIG